MEHAKQYIQKNQFSQLDLPFQLQAIPQKTLQINNYKESKHIILYVHFSYSQYLQKVGDMLNVSLQELLQTISTKKMRNCFEYVNIRNYEDYKTDSNPQASIQSDYQALLILLYFLSLNNQLYSLDISWSPPLPFLDFNEVVNLIASFQNLKSLVLKIPCNSIKITNNQVLLRSFSSRIICQHNLTTLHITFNLEKCSFNSLEFLEFLSDLISNLRFLQTIFLNILNRAYSDIAIDSLIALSLHPSLKSISILAEKLISDDNNGEFQDKNISETYLNKLTSSQLQQVHLHSIKSYDFNLLFAILARLPFLMKFSMYSDFSTSIDTLRFPIIPFKRNVTFPVLESIQINIFSRLNVQFGQEVINGLSQFKTHKIAWYLGSKQSVNLSDLGLEKTLITISQGQIIYESNFEQTPSADMLKDYLLFRNSVRISICAFKKFLWRYMPHNPLHVILDLYMDL